MRIVKCTVLLKAVKADTTIRRRNASVIYLYKENSVL